MSSLLTIDVCHVTKGLSTTSDTGEWIRGQRIKDYCDVLILYLLDAFRIHIKENHEGIEPKENFSPELFANVEDHVCLICVKKYKGRAALKGHLLRVHLGLESVEEGKDPIKEFEEGASPRKDPLQEDKGDDPLSGGGEEADPPGDRPDVVDLDSSKESVEIQEVNIEAIKSNGVSRGKDDDEKDKNGEKENESSSEQNDEQVENTELSPQKESTASDNTSLVSTPKISKPKVLSERDKELLQKMFHNLKRFGCAFCKDR